MITVDNAEMERLIGIMKEEPLHRRKFTGIDGLTKPSLPRMKSCVFLAHRLNDTGDRNEEDEHRV